MLVLEAEITAEGMAGCLYAESWANVPAERFAPYATAMQTPLLFIQTSRVGSISGCGSWKHISTRRSSRPIDRLLTERKAYLADQKQGATRDVGNDQSQLSPPTISLPKGGGAVRRIGERFTAQSATGTGALTVPIVASPGWSDFGPQLSFSYDSGSGNGSYDLGWNINLPVISRKTDKGLPRYDDEHESDVFIVSGSEDLVPVLDSSRQRKQVERTLHRIHYRLSFYRPRVEGLFARIERWVNVRDGIAHWRTISRDNLTTFYGTDASSRIADPADPLRIFSWSICRTFDAKGNITIYEYVREDDRGVDLGQSHETNRGGARATQHYLKRALYGNTRPYFADWSAAGSDFLPTEWDFELVFDYGDHSTDRPPPQPDQPWPVRPDPFSTYRSRFEVRTYRRCRRVLMFHHFPDEANVGRDCVVASTELTYSDELEPIQDTSPIYSYVSLITQASYRREKDGYRRAALPPLQFEYSRPRVSSEVHSLDAGSLANLPEGLDNTRYEWVDLNGERLSGILTSVRGGWFYKRNLSPLPQSQSGSAGQARFGPMQELATLPSQMELGEQRLVDLSGDGQLDVVTLNDRAAGFFERTTDGDWESLRTFSSLPRIDWSGKNLRFVDLTVRRQDHHIALQAARARETSVAYTTEYARRAGIEGTLSPGIRAYGRRHARYIGEVKTHLQHVLTAAAINFVRMGNWLMKKPLAKTRTSAFQPLLKQPICC